MGLEKHRSADAGPLQRTPTKGCRRTAPGRRSRFATGAQPSTASSEYKGLAAQVGRFSGSSNLTHSASIQVVTAAYAWPRVALLDRLRTKKEYAGGTLPLLAVIVHSRRAGRQGAGGVADTTGQWEGCRLRSASMQTSTTWSIDQPGPSPTVAAVADSMIVRGSADSPWNPASHGRTGVSVYPDILHTRKPQESPGQAARTGDSSGSRRGQSCPANRPRKCIRSRTVKA